MPSSLSEVVGIAHRDVAVTVAGSYQAVPSPLEGVRLYLFTESGTYRGVYTNTDALGRAVFNLPERSYKIRADYLGYQFWSAAFTGTDTTVTLPHGRARLHVTKGGLDIADAPVYLFTASGSYQGKMVRTDGTGTAVFMLPTRGYKFRIDHNGVQYWSDEFTLLPDEETPITLNLDLLAMEGDSQSDPR